MMKIFNINNGNSQNRINPQNNYKAKVDETKTNRAGNYDKITLDQGSAPKTDAQFITLLKNKLVSEVKEGIEPQKVEDLTKQVALNTYSISPAEISRKIMLELDR